MTTTEIVDHDDKTRALTREEFCELERMTIVTYKKLENLRVADTCTSARGMMDRKSG